MILLNQTRFKFEMMMMIIIIIIIISSLFHNMLTFRINN